MEPLNAANPYGATLEEVLAGETLTGDALMTYIATRLSSLDEDIKLLIGQQQEALAKKQYVNQVKDWAAGLEHGSTGAGNDGTTQPRPFQGGRTSPSMNAYQVSHVATDPKTSPIGGGRTAGTPLVHVSQAEPNNSTSNGARGTGISYMQVTNAASDSAGEQAAETTPDGNEAPAQSGSFPGGGSELGDLPEQLYEAFQDHCGPGKGVDEDTLKSFTAKLDSVLDEINGASELNMIRLQQLMGQRQVCIQLTTNLLSKLASGEESIAANCK